MAFAAAAGIAERFGLLQDKASKRVLHDSPTAVPSGRANIGHLKEFYLERLAKKEPDAAARLGGYLSGGSANLPTGSSGGYLAGSASSVASGQPQASGQTSQQQQLLLRPAFGATTAAPAPPAKEMNDMEIMCNNCFALIKISEASCHDCSVFAQRNQTAQQRAESGIALLDYKLRKVRAALEVRLQDSSNKVNVMRHLTQLRYHIDTSAKWTIGCSEIGALSDHTVQQVKQLTATSRVLAPAVYVFSKRIETVVVQKERELRRLQVAPPVAGDAPQDVSTGVRAPLLRPAEDREESVADVKSVLSEMDSDCGTQYAETVLTQDSASQHGPAATDVGNMNDANEYLSLKSEDEQRRWFYSQCLTVKLACPDKAKARKTLISDLYSRVKTEKVPIEGWVRWIRKELLPDEEAGATGVRVGAVASARSLETTTAVPMR